MIFLTTLATGVITGMLRSVLAVIVVSFLICATFACAALTGPASLVSFVLSILGFNAGLVLLLGGYLVFSAHSPTT